MAEQKGEGKALVTKHEDLERFLKDYRFSECGQRLTLSAGEKPTRLDRVQVGGTPVPRYSNEFWTSKQRKASSIHEVSYRACFKPQLPRFFIHLFTEPGDTVYDPFSGRGTTVLEAALQGRRIISNDTNPLSRMMAQPRLEIPALGEIQKRLNAIPFDPALKADMELGMFFHPRTEAEIVSLQLYLREKKKSGTEDEADRWIRMVATNRLTGHSRGFFSVYTLPPNQAVSPERQKKINEKRKQEPEYRNIRELILKKTRSLLRKVSEEEKTNLSMAARTAVFLEQDARHTAEIPPRSVQLTVTSPPFLDVVQYSSDNWLRCWFNGLDSEEIEKRLTMAGKVQAWSAVMQEVFHELYRVTRSGGWVAFEVGEVKAGTVNLEEHVVPLGLEAGFDCRGILVNKQNFTKTSNIWGVNNNAAGTNTNRIVLFQKG